jgi:hypothetical protein
VRARHELHALRPEVLRTRVQVVLERRRRALQPVGIDAALALGGDEGIGAEADGANIDALGLGALAVAALVELAGLLVREVEAIGLLSGRDPLEL